MPPRTPNHRLQAAREEAFGPASRTQFSRAVKRRCEELFGGHCGVDHRKARRWECGACDPDAYHQQAICDVLSVPWSERDRLGFPVPAKPDSTPQAAPARPLDGGECPRCGGRAGAARLTGNSRLGGTAAKRRDFIGLARAFACTPAPLDALERLAASLQRPAAVDEALVRDVERLTAAVGAAYDTTAPRRLLAPARQLAHRTTRLLDASMHPTQRQRLLRCTSETVLVIGWLRFNQDERIDAQAYFLLTERMAEEAPDDVMRARALGALSCMHSTTQQGGDTAKALQLAARANTALPVDAPADVGSWLAIREAVEHAASHDASGYHRLMERAEAAVAQTRSRLGLFGGWDGGVLNGHKGTCLRLLEQPAAAERLLHEGLAQSSLARPRARMATDLTRVYTALDDAEATCGMAGQAVGFILEVKYVLGLRRLFIVRSAFPDAWADLSYVQELDERLRMAARTLGVKR
ncbi:MAG: hypothetical protein ACRD0K_17895 [Egibacteraceae bacterium]